jgi:hypothetical protein
MADWSDYKLGDETGDLLLESFEDNQQAALSLVSQGETTLDIFTRDLEPRNYNNQTFAEAVKNMALKNKNVKVRVLVIDPDLAIKQGHSLINLSRRLTSYIEVRKVHEDYTSIPEAYLIVDHRGVLYRNLASRYEGTVNYNLPMRAAELLRTFNEIWEKSKSYIDFKQLNI